MTKKTFFILIFCLISIFSIIKTGPMINYSTWSIDEEQLVTFALSFLGNDFNPRWFEYHTLPMYILYTVYLAIYYCYIFLEVVSSRVEFASLLFSNDAIFFISSKLLCSFIYTTSCAVLAYIIYKQYRSAFATITFFIIANLLPDALTASITARVDTFVFLFLTLTIYFSCFAKKNLLNFLLAILFCAAAIASKLPAIIFFPILLGKIATDIYRKELPVSYFFMVIVLVPAATFLFMPYFFLDYESLRPTIDLIIARTKGEFVHVGKIHSYSQWGKIIRYWEVLASQVSWMSIVLSIFLFIFSIFKRRIFLFPCLFIGGFASTFITSATLDSYWLRPIYPFLILFSIIMLLEFSKRIVSLYCSVTLSTNHTNKQALACILLAHAPIALFLTGYFTFHNQHLSTYLQAVQNSMPDNRINASKWIVDNIPEGSLIMLESTVPHYLPRVFSQNKQTTLDLSGLNVVGNTSNSPFMTKAYLHYFKNHLPESKNFVISLMDRNLYIKYDMSKMIIPQGAYMIITSAMYDRFDKEYSMQADSELTIKAQQFYNIIKRQKLIKKFNLRGTVIDIYLMQESINYPNQT